MKIEELNELGEKIRYLPRDVRLAAFSSILSQGKIDVDVTSDGGYVYLHQCDVEQSIGVIAEILGFFDEAEELGLLPQQN